MSGAENGDLRPKNECVKAFRPLRLALRVGFGMLFLAVCLASGICWRIHSSNASETRAVFPPEPAPVAHERILVFSPHCDDESLGVGGYINAAVRNGANVRVVMMTNGDGFNFAAALHYRRIRVTPAVLRAFALDRQQETLAAESALGVPHSHVVFLGFPDRGLSALWSDHWSKNNPYYSTFTGTNRDPYRTSLRPGELYCGENVLTEVEGQIKEFHPDLVLATHPNDDHPDHWATGCFVRAALAEISLNDPGLAARIRYQTYVVHHGDWPVPQGFHPNIRLAPPFSLAHTDTRWSEFRLSPAEERAKESAIYQYHSQMAVESRFLDSFIRTTECFGSLPRSVLDMKKPDGGQPILLQSDPLSDTLANTVERSANIRNIDARLEGNGVLFQIGFRGAPSPRVAYHVDLQSVRSGGQSIQRWTCVAHGSHTHSNIPGGRAWVSGSILNVQAPASAFEGSRVWFMAAETRMASMMVDRSGWREFRVQQ